ncbi:MAG: zinc-binding alcohol dehydrogenase family protein [Burkholderiales bacterium]|nr:zinc-binding alcohol dehydrogenase family protein [Burkholderiales bacterium]
MKAVGLYKSLAITDAASLINLELPKPELNSENDLLVKVEAIAVNPVDYKVRLSILPEASATPKLLGWDVSGIVIASANPSFKAGDKVFYAGDITRPGANSEYHLVDSRIVGHMPDNLSFVQAASLPLTSLTAWESLFERLQVEKDKEKTLLIINGAGGVGSITTQLAKHLTKLKVIVTASRPESIEWCRKQGADYIINHREDIVSQVRNLGYEFVDYILVYSNISDHIKACGELIVPFGKICSIVETKTGELDITPLKTKSAALLQEFMFTRAMYKTSDMIEQQNILNNISKLVQKQIITPTVNEILTPINAENLRQAHEVLEKGQSIGKIVLTGF